MAEKNGGKEKKKANYNSEFFRNHQYIVTNLVNWTYFGKEAGKHTQRPYDRYANTSVTVRLLSRLCEGIVTVRD